MFRNWKFVISCGLTALALCLTCLLAIPGEARAAEYGHPFPGGFWNYDPGIFVEDENRDWNGDGEPDGTDRFGGAPNDGILFWPAGIHYVGGNNVGFGVPENCRLEIPAGSSVIFSEGGGGTVGGTLIANGTAEQPIVFTCSKKEKGAWSSLRISKTAGPETILNHCTIEYGGQGDWCLLSVYGDNDPQGPHPAPTITNCLIRNSNTVGLKIHFDANPIIRDCRFEDNDEWPVAISNNLKAYTFEGCTAGGNGTNGICITSYQGGIAIPGDIEFYNYPTLPYYLCYALSVPDQRNLTIHEGAVLHLYQPLFMEPGSGLNIEPGVIIKGYDNNSYITCNGLFTALGTAEKPIIFTSGKAAPAPGDWSGVSIVNQSANGSRLQHCSFSYAGNPDWNRWGNLILGGQYSSDTPPTDILVDQCSFFGSKSNGIHSSFNSEVTVTNCTSDNNAHSAYAIWIANNVGRFENNTGSGNGSNNDGNRIVIDTNNWTISPNKNLQLYKNSIPYWINQRLSVDTGITVNLASDATAISYNGISLNGGTLELDPGSTVKMGKDSHFTVSNQGTLLARGTAAQNALITSAEAAPAPGDWSGICFTDTASANSRLEYTTVEYGGKDYCGNVRLGWNYGPVPAGTPLISNCALRYSSTAGISAGHASTPVIQGCRIENNEYGITTDDSRNEGLGGTVTLTASPDNTFTGNSKYDISNGFHGGTIDARNNDWGTTDTANIDRRIFDKNDDAQYGTVQYLPLGGGGIKNLPEKINQPADKVWTITFSRPVDAKTVTTDTVFVFALDPAAHKIAGINIVVNPADNTKVFLSPPATGWPLAQDCYIIVKNSVQSADGRRLAQGVRLKFTAI